MWSLLSENLLIKLDRDAEGEIKEMELFSVKCVERVEIVVTTGEIVCAPVRAHVPATEKYIART